jgi:hypothetical protein
LNIRHNDVLFLLQYAKQIVGNYGCDFFLGSDIDASQEVADFGNTALGSVGSASRRKYCKKEFVRSEIKTRAAVFPKFALKVKTGHLTRKRWQENTDVSYVSTRSSCSQPRYSICIGAHYIYL